MYRPHGQEHPPDNALLLHRPVSGIVTMAAGAENSAVVALPEPARWHRQAEPLGRYPVPGYRYAIQRHG